MIIQDIKGNDIDVQPTGLTHTERMASIDKLVIDGPKCVCRGPKAKASCQCLNPVFWQAHIDRLLLIYAPLPIIVKLGGRMGHDGQDGQSSAMPWAGTIVGDKFYGDGHEGDGREGYGGPHRGSHRGGGRDDDFSFTNAIRLLEAD